MTARSVLTRSEDLDAKPALFKEIAKGSNRPCDVLVYGSTPSGICAAIEAARRGLKVILACPKTHLGGMSASGLCTTDVMRREMFGGLVTEFAGVVLRQYRNLLKERPNDIRLVNDGWNFEPSVAEQAFQNLITSESERLTWLPGYWLSRVMVKAGRIDQVSLDGPKSESLIVTARTFIDGTYEGDLAAAAKVPFPVGREGREEYGESLAGIHYMNWRSGRQIPTADTGEPSPAIQAYCARSIFTDDAAYRVPIAQPDSYDEHLPDLLPLLDDFNTGRVKSWNWGTPLPRRKFQMNGDIEALTSLNCPGVSWAWPEAERHHRERLERFHLDHAASLIYFLQNDPHVPEQIRLHIGELGLHRHEFTDSGYWPWQIYVRQGRRIEGRHKLTQHSFTADPKTGRTPRVDQPIALGEYSFDVHACHDRRFAVQGFMEGVLWYHRDKSGFAQPGQVPYGAMLPEQIDNLLVPVALSSTHVAMSVLRMEPVWMTTGQIAGLAAATAADQQTDVAHIDPVPLPGILKIPVDPFSAK